MQNQATLLSSNRQDWETPNTLYNALNNEFHFTVDVCALPHNAKHPRYFTPKMNGLDQNWANEVCWMNPPYGREQIKWIEKAFEESKKGATIVCLIPARPDTRIWHDIIFPHAEVRFIRGRITFVGAESPAPFPSALVIFGQNIDVGVIKIMNRI